MSDRLTLHVVAGSHPCLAVLGALRHKKLDFDLIERLLRHRSVAAAHSVRRANRPVPARRPRSRVGSRMIMRALDGIEPEPPLIPSDPELRAAVDEADRWGDEVLQEETRWVALRAAAGRPDAFPSYLRGARMPAPPRQLLGPVVRGYFAVGARALGHHSHVSSYLRSLPGHLNYVDRLIADGVLGSQAPTAADFQIGASIRLLSTIADLDLLLADRPCRRLAISLFPDYPGHTPAGALAL